MTLEDRPHVRILCLLTVRAKYMAQESSAFRTHLAPLPTRRTVIGLGSNLGDRRGNLVRAIAALVGLPGIELLGRSSVWQTSPVGGPPQPDFYNAAVVVASSLDPVELLDSLLRIEERFGRIRTIRNGPRPHDLDILWIEGNVVDHPRLQVPHPRLSHRAFALAPLLELVPEAADPRSKVAYALTFGRLGAAGIRQLRAPLDASSA